MNKEFAKDVMDGLNADPKTLPSKYFYDKKGDAIFQEIMDLDEYYLTRAEYEVFESNKSALASTFLEGADKFDLIEFGAGDGHKTRVLLKHFLEVNINFEYLPIDISGNVLEQLRSTLKTELPRLVVKPIQDDYFHALEKIEKSTNVRSIVLFLGSNIGNFKHKKAVEFLSELYSRLKVNDLLLIGFDLKKDPDVILHAYNDSKGVTRAFNLNLLDRINNELDANFDRSKFIHYPIYNPSTGTTKSFLVSTESQTVEILDTAVNFDAWEAIHTEVSQKYSLKDIQRLAQGSGFSVVDNFFDSKNFFVDSVWRKS
ncbi:MAG: L-histidine N(alpha)-methyltransferase [Bacteroidota bacterium]